MHKFEPNSYIYWDPKRFQSQEYVQLSMQEFPNSFIDLYK